MALLRRFSAGLLAATIIMLGIVMGGLRLGFANIDFFKSEITYVLSEQGIPGVVFSEVRADWNYFNPILEIRNVSITLADGSQALFVDNLIVEFDFWASLTRQAPVVLEISGKIEKLELIRDESGHWWMDQFQLSSDSEQIVAPEFAQTLTLIPRYLKLDLHRLIVKDRASRKTYQLDRIAANIKYQQNQYFVRLSAALPASLGRAVELKAVLNRDRSVVYINSSNVKLGRVGKLLGIDTGEFKAGVIDGEIWLNLAGQRIVAVNGKVYVDKGLLQISDDKAPISIEYQSQFSAVNKDSYWRINNSVGTLKINDFSLRGFHTQLQVSDWERQRVISAWVNRFELANLPILGRVLLPVETSKILSQSQPQGRLEDVLVDVDFSQLNKIRVSARAVNVSSRAAGSFPGIENLNGKMRGEGNKFGFELSGSKMRIDFGDLFRAPLELENFELSAVANIQQSGLVLSITKIDGVNEDIKVAGRLWLESEPQQAPFMHLRVNYSEGRGSNASKYLPVKILPPKTLQWLDRGIIEGFVKSGDLLYHGRLKTIRQLHLERSGEFYAGFDIEDADIFFAPGWLHATKGKGRVVFHNESMNIDLEQVSYDRLDNLKARVAIENLGHNSVLDIAIEADMSTQQAFQTWVDTPVGERYRSIVSRLQGLQGQVSSNIEIQIPLTSGPTSQQVKVRLELDNGGARVDDWGLDLSDVKGIINVTNEGVFASQVEARYFGDPLRINIAPDKDTGDTLVFADGILETTNVLNRLPADLTRNITGKSDWKIKLLIAGNSDSDDQAYLSLNAVSNLENTKIGLPEPFVKDAQESTSFTADVNFFKNRLDFTADLADDIHFSGRLAAKGDDSYQTETIDIAFSTGLRPVYGSGLNLYGRIPYLSIPDWLEVLDSSGFDSPELLQSADLSIDQLFSFNRELGGFEVKVDRYSNGFTGHMISPVIKGSFHIPRDRSPGKPVSLDLEYLVITRGESEADESVLLPGDFFDIHLTSKKLVYNEMEFSDLLVDARVEDDSLYLDSLNMRHQEVYLVASSSWDYSPGSGKHYTNMKASIQGKQFGQAMSALGFGDSIDNGEIDFKSEIAWTSPLPDPDWSSLAGDASLKLTNGILNEVEAGSGRLVGLLSLSAIPRRLALDFKDITAEGMEFDIITGNYRVDSGLLHTEDTLMEGITAEIRITGNTDLNQRSYDQQMFVTPKIRHSLPVIGAVAAGASVGLSLLILQNLFKDVIDKVIEIEYKITGSWEDPQIELVKATDENNKVYRKIDK